MKTLLAVATLMLSGAASVQTPAAPPATPLVSIVRLDCGTVVVNDLDQFSDTRAYVGQTRRLTDSCYLIRHGENYLLWDTGLPAAMKGAPVDAKAPMSPTLTTTVIEQLATLGIAPARITTIGISHYHFDHIGQAASFPAATLMIGKDDLDALKANKPGVDGKPLARWLTGGGKIDAVTGDKDVFGDGSVVMLTMPGHTPGHHSLLVRLKRGHILLTGDVAHFRENYDSDGVPSFNVDRADSLASIARFKGIARNLKATVIIQHDARDVAKLPAFPAAAQ